MSTAARVFLSYGGNRSQKAASVFHSAFQKVAHECKANVKPWLSSADGHIAAGTKFRSDILKNINGASHGVCFFNPSNIYNQWINFECGAMCLKLEAQSGGSSMAPSRFFVFFDDQKSGFIPDTIRDRQVLEFAMPGIEEVMKAILYDHGVEHDSFDKAWRRLFEQISCEWETLECYDAEINEFAFSSLCWLGHDLMWVLSAMDDKDCKGWEVCHGLAHMLLHLENVNLCSTVPAIKTIHANLKNLLSAIEQSSVHKDDKNIIVAVKPKYKLPAGIRARIKKDIVRLREAFRYTIDNLQLFPKQLDQYDFTRILLHSRQQI